ncbi:winged helix-turn-helix domain-containing protein [Deinococcus hopiensis]|uniref:winged helix-turn-helix domain-containing protein n=1 Tax=Deinococcus hopiensis TaxID=309885 RepID=UPI001482DD5E
MRQEELFRALQRPPVSGGLWTSKKVQRHIQEYFRIELTEVCGWDYLKRLGFIFQTLWLTHVEATFLEEQGAPHGWGASSRERLSIHVVSTHPGRGGCPALG